MRILEANTIDIGYQEALQRGLSFDVSKGDILFVSGANGTGKTTLIKTLLGEVSILSGELKVKDGLRTEYLPQLLQYDFPLSLTLDEILDIYEVPKRIKNFLSEDQRSLCWQDASGGQKQKTLILSRLSRNQDILFLDEPFNHVDKESSSQLMNFFQELIFEGFISSLVIISHVIPSELNHENIKGLKLQ